jgi:hypothetical protein
VFLSQLRQLVAANVGVIDISRLMGHVLGHEIEHLLLNSSVHSLDGLMRAGFRREDLKKAIQRRLTISPVSQLPIRTSVVPDAFPRRRPAARSGLSRPASEASYASRRTAVQRRLIVDAA